MSERQDPDPVRAHFRRDAEYWGTVYDDGEDRAGAVYRERLERVLACVDELELVAPARIVDVGAGAGLASVALAQRGHEVLAVDSTKRMLELTETRAAAAGTPVRVAEADARACPSTTGALMSSSRSVSSRGSSTPHPCSSSFDEYYAREERWWSRPTTAGARLSSPIRR